jgi:hypothetical protein
MIITEPNGFVGEIHGTAPCPLNREILIDHVRQVAR